jgi:hypothetical protein
MVASLMVEKLIEQFKREVRRFRSEPRPNALHPVDASPRQGSSQVGGRIKGGLKL